MSKAKPYSQTLHSWWIDSLFLLLVLGLLFFLLLGARPLFTPDEGRYAEIAREMVARGDYVTPYLNSIKYFEKPILFYWLESAAIKIAGLNLWSLRGVNALLGLAGCLLTYFTARRLYGRSTGLLAAMILGTSTLYFVMTRMISLDLTVTLFLTLTLYAFLLGSLAPYGKARRLYLYAASVAAALAVLTKGLIGLVFPLMIIGTFMAMTGEWRSLKRFYLPSCLALFLLIALPWHGLVGWRNPEFFYFYFIEQHFLRYTNMNIGHYQPAWFFLPNLVLGFFPWVVFLPQALGQMGNKVIKQPRTYKTELFFLLWIVLIFAFFSFSKSKLIPYILPLFPPLAILVARYLQGAMQHAYRWGTRIGYACLVFLTLAIAGAFYLFLRDTPLPYPHTAAYLLYSAVALLGTGALAGGIMVYRQAGKAIMITTASAWLFLLLLMAAFPAIDTRTILPLAQLLQPQLTPTDEVITFNQYYQDLPFYLKRRITILNWKNELTYGMRHQDTQEWMINNTVFWQRWHSPQRVFVILSEDSYQRLLQRYPQEKFHLLGKTLTNALISNRPKSSSPLDMLTH